MSPTPETSSPQLPEQQVSRMPAGRTKLRLGTYMCPSHPVELYELFMKYLEEELPCEATLMYESRGGGPLPDREDPFTADSLDIAFVTPTAYVKLQDSKNPHVELLPVAAVFQHPRNKAGEPGYFSDIIIHVDYEKHVSKLLDLRGCNWAYSSEHSLSGSAAILKALKEQGENAAFFGNMIRSGSHLKSVQMVLSKQAEAAAVDANTLSYNKKYLQDKGKDIIVLESFGPLPPYPIVVNSRLSATMKEKITQALLKMHNCRLWGERLSNFGISKLVPNNENVYEKERELRSSIQNTSVSVTYY
ncbi:hypothetical protein FOCC_FOCC016871 [Frankliniella occidentalis]|uniref:Uncharacterized protein LOC113212959 n=1 Tax=Frankliniella occidentalis TaxID=133901 RepID=A0A6J1TA69_FRAOC|nr:uncharacterized protein LOC113212959 [Frankliniella occidentalis]KAE8737663.1 hypothetical protein FOCC_FOCC016871 [Frankliniella occidentalis]